MSWLTNLAGSGAGIIAVAVGVLILRHMTYAPGIVHPWLRRLVIVIMYAGGTALAVTTLGALAISGITHAASLVGGLGYGLVRTILVVAILFLLFGVIVGLIWAPDPATAIVAAILPVLLALPLGGIIHGADVALNGPAMALAQALNHLVAG
jgi:hypothetical protein